jgi:putative MATE family efflux protein
VDAVNLLVSASLTRGWFGLPEMGFRGIAVGTVTAYVVGGVLMVTVLSRGRRRGNSVGIRLYLHRLRPHWRTLRRVLRIGLPSGFADTLTWVAQFFIVVIINRIDVTNVSAAAHIVTIRVESLSYMTGFAVSVAAATMVGQSLGMRNAARATRVAHLAYFIGAGAMLTCGVCFFLFGHSMARVLTSDPGTIALAGRCLRITAFAQAGFAAAIVFGGALRGAGDTVAVMAINLASTIGLRLVAVLVVTLWLGYGLAAVWVVLSVELSVRGVLMYLRFLQGGWKHVRV